MFEETRLLQEKVIETYGREAEFLTRVRFADTSGSVTVVHVFRLHRHPEAKFCYAWNQNGPNGRAIVTVLGIPGIESAEDAFNSYADEGAS